VGQHDGMMTMDYKSYRIFNLQVIPLKISKLSPNIHTGNQMTVKITLQLCFAVFASQQLHCSKNGIG
jgi:hypothetical protein